MNLINLVKLSYFIVVFYYKKIQIKRLIDNDFALLINRTFMSHM
jgi:hypothetical protein